MCCNFILKCFHSRGYKLLIKAFKTYIRPVLKYGTTVWYPTDIGNINSNENTQRLFTRKVAFLKASAVVLYK